MPTEDARKTFLISMAAEFLGLGADKVTCKELQESSALNSFLEDGSVGMLVGCCDAGELHLDNEVNAVEGRGTIIVFYKVHARPIMFGDLRNNILVLSFSGSAISSLYTAVRQVYSPILLKHEWWETDSESRLHKLLMELQAVLGRLARLGPASRLSDSIDMEEHLSGIITPSDEFEFWAEVAGSLGPGPRRERAQHFQTLFQPLVKLFSHCETWQLDEGQDLVDVSRQVIEEVWGQTEHSPYPESRMQHLLHLIAGAFCWLVRHRLSTLDIWTGSFGFVQPMLNKAETVCRGWLDACQQLTRPGTLRHWHGDCVQPEELVELADKLREVQLLRTMLSQVEILLSPLEQGTLGVKQTLQPLCSQNPFHYSMHNQAPWRAAVSEFDSGMVQAERKAAEKLALRLRGAQGSVVQLLAEFLRFRELMARPNVSHTLYTERETLLGRLLEHIRGT